MPKRVTIAPTNVIVLDPVWHPVLGIRLELPGGTELVPVMRNTLAGWIDRQLQLVHIVNDPYFPSVRVSLLAIELAVVTLELPDGQHGPRVGKGRKRCTAGVHQRRVGAASDWCLPCYYQQWADRARKVGMIIEAEEH